MNCMSANELENEMEKEPSKRGKVVEVAGVLACCPYCRSLFLGFFFFGYQCDWVVWIVYMDAE